MNIKTFENFQKDLDLTSEERGLLIDLLSLELEKIGFEEDQIEIFERIFDKLGGDKNQSFF